MNHRYQEFQGGMSLPAVEQEVLARWQTGNAFEESVRLRDGAPSFVFYEGPPSANGMPGIHHVISRTLKDLVCRYKTMKGFQVQRKGGWDTHGLPIELGVEKALGITKEDIGKTISVADYNRHCREAVLRYKKEWDEITTRMGYWVDLNHPYITFENNYIETLWWLLSRMYNRGLLYESVSIQPYSPAAGTGLSSHELNQPGTYKDVKDTSATVLFTLVPAAQQTHNRATAETLEAAAGGLPVQVMAWTTTPWTLPSNLGLTVGPNVRYVLVKASNPYTQAPQAVLLAEALLHKYFTTREGEEPAFEIVANVSGRELEELRYEQLLPFEANSAEVAGGDNFRILCGDFVTTEDGTGVVHTAPAFGADDYKVGRQYGLGMLVMVDRQGRFLPGLGEFSNRYVKNYTDDPHYADVNVDICVRLKKEGKAWKVEKYEHSYPHCWRTDKPILYYPLDAWFIRTSALKERMVALNKTIQWKPRSTGEGRFGNWLENMVDWNLSRSRYWGTPLPIWKTEDGSEEVCIGSIAELKERLHEDSPVQNIDDLHKPFIDEVWLKAGSGAVMKRVPDLIDVWFDSGAMPYAQHHFPFENKEIFARNYPASFIAEGVDQTRGWFYTLHAIAALVKEDVQAELAKAGLPAGDDQVPGLAYRTVVSNGLVLDRFGNKMSKRLGNVVDPFETIGQFGADATRWYLITNASPWDNLKFDTNGIAEVQRRFFGTLYNTYQFFVLYANVDGFAFQEAYLPLAERPEIDRWILSALNTLVADVTKAYDDYEPTVAGRLIEDFTNELLSNWYVRLCRRRFWKGAYETDKISAYQTLYECLETLCRLMAPIAPFFADELFGRMNAVTGRFAEASVHHVLFPEADKTVVDEDLERRMELARQVCSLVLSIRKKVNIKVRQPLQKILIPVLDATMEQRLQKVEDLIRAEVNVKEIEYLSGERSNLISKKAKANFKTLGAKLGKRMKAAAAQIQVLSNVQIAGLEKDGQLSLTVEGEEVVITTADVEITANDIPGWSVASAEGLTVALDVTVTDALELEGLAREFVNRIQNIRKDSGFELTDRIIVAVQPSAADKALDLHKPYICAEILADDLVFQPGLNDAQEIEINDLLLKVSVTKHV